MDYAQMYLFIQKREDFFIINESMQSWINRNENTLSLLNIILPVPVIEYLGFKKINFFKTLVVVIFAAM